MFSAVWHRFHQTPLSRAVSGSPLISTIAEKAWVGFQRKSFFSTLAKMQSPGDRPIAEPPFFAFLDPKKPQTVETGRKFAFQMGRYCDANKFHEFGYQVIYGSIFQLLNGANPRVLEIGIGVADPTAPSGMPAGYSQGASLVGWSRAFGDAEVHGADIDLRTLGENPWFDSHYVNQLSKPSINRLASDLGGQWDLIIDDGLHTPEANANSLWGFLPRLSNKGFFVVEDILPRYDSLWRKLESNGVPGFFMRFFPGEQLDGPAGLAVFSRASSPSPLEES